MKKELFVNNFVIKNINMLNRFGIGQTYYLKKELLEIEFKHDKTIITDLTNALTNKLVKKYIINKTILNKKHLIKVIKSINKSKEFIRLGLKSFELKKELIPGVFKYSPFYKASKINIKTSIKVKDFINVLMQDTCKVKELNFIDLNFNYSNGSTNKEYFFKKFIENYSKKLIFLKKVNNDILCKYGNNSKVISF